MGAVDYLRPNAFRTAIIAARWLNAPTLLSGLGFFAVRMGRPTGLEPATPRSTILCSNQLSYDRRKSEEWGLSRPLKVLSTRFPVVSWRRA